MALQSSDTSIQPNADGTRASARSVLSGEVVYLYAFDIAYEMTRRSVPTLLGQPVADFSIGSSKRMPRQAFFYRAQMVRLPALERLTPHGPVRLERSIKLLPVGAISVMIRVPFANLTLEELTDFHDFRFADNTSVFDEARMLAEEASRELRAYLIRPVEQLRDEEAYTVFCLNPLTNPDGSAVCCENWLHDHKHHVAALLTEEPDVDRLSPQETDESTSKFFSYYNKDLIVIDWDAALIIDEPRYYDETLYLMELANVQLAELEAYDRMLDTAVETSYRDIARRRWLLSWQSTGAQNQLREIRIDLARLSDELLNITKFFGDWHLARIYQGISARFHLADWHRTIDDKLKTLGELYDLLRSEQNNRWMLTLEVSVVVLFVIDLIVLFQGGKH